MFVLFSCSSVRILLATNYGKSIRVVCFTDAITNCF